MDGAGHPGVLLDTAVGRAQASATQLVADECVCGVMRGVGCDLGWWGFWVQASTTHHDTFSLWGGCGVVVFGLCRSTRTNLERITTRQHHCAQNPEQAVLLAAESKQLNEGAVLCRLCRWWCLSGAPGGQGAARCGCPGREVNPLGQHSH